MFRPRLSLLLPLPLLLVACPVINTPSSVLDLNDLRVLSGNYAAVLTSESSELPVPVSATLEVKAAVDPETSTSAGVYTAYLVAGKLKMDNRTFEFAGKVNGAGVNTASAVTSYSLDTPLTEDGKEVGSLVGTKARSDVTTTQKLTIVFNDPPRVYTGEFRR